MLLQVPVFIGLFHVLRSFNRTAHGMGQLGMSPEETRSVGNYIFNVDQVQNFLDARLFGVPLSSFITEPKTEWAAFVQPGQPIDFTRVDIAIVVIPMMIIASIATHMNSRASVARQPEAALENPQTRMMNMLALYIFPLGILVTGAFFPVAILLYWMSNNVWTYGQQHLVFGRIAREEEEARLAKQEKLKANAPKPGVKPDRTKKLGDGQGSENGVDLEKADGAEEASDNSAESTKNASLMERLTKALGIGGAGSAKASGSKHETRKLTPRHPRPRLSPRRQARPVLGRLVLGRPVPRGTGMGPHPPSRSRDRNLRRRLPEGREPGQKIRGRRRAESEAAARAAGAEPFAVLPHHGPGHTGDRARHRKYE